MPVLPCLPSQCPFPALPLLLLLHTYQTYLPLQTGDVNPVAFSPPCYYLYYNEPLLPAGWCASLSAWENGRG